MSRDEQVKTSEPGADESSSDAITAVQRERDELQDRLLRTAAEFDNFRKRTDRERRDLSDAVSADLVRDLLPVVDDLERALAAADELGEDRSPLASGVDLIYRQLLEILRRRGVEPIAAVGRDFDPSWHEAIASEPADGHRDGEVIAELRRGYRIGPRLVRPAQVRVAKA
jgi:molecular chaperone GrpE